jgi:gamma-glutamylcyclotransferase (GGCT)/AIG2-like uncharacterized protein YtfP
MSEPARLFVYGTLMRGESRHFYITRHDVDWIAAARTPGRLLDLGEYPGLIATTRGWVFGELIQFRSVSFDEIDRMEGDEYVREEVDVVSERGPFRAWTYRLIRLPAQPCFIRDGRWRSLRNTARTEE